MFWLTMILACAQTPKGKADDLTTAVGDGYRGIWYMNQPVKSEYVYKYSGGFATYPQQHVPIAIHVPEQRKTFFAFGGSAGNVSERRDELQHLVAYYDHADGTVSRPVRILQKRTEDAHDNPTLSIDAAGHLYVFSAAHGVSRPSYIFRSRKPYDVAAWDMVLKTNFSYPQPWYLPESQRFLFLHTRYVKGERTLNFQTSADGRAWSEPFRWAHLEAGDYQVSWRERRTDRVGTAFDLHPTHGRPGKGLNFRTNLYYAETRDAGRTWTTAAGAPLSLPLGEAKNPALVRDYRAENLNVYIKDLDFDAAGRPAILYLTSKGFMPGPESGPYEWRIAHWAGTEWRFWYVTTSDHNYDHGSLYTEDRDAWRIVAPMEPGPQPFGAGGEIAMWTSRDRGETWALEKKLTKSSRYNHTYARKPVAAHPDFYALWADGSPRAPTPSSLYFAAKDGRVFRLPTKMTTEKARPEQID